MLSNPETGKQYKIAWREGGRLVSGNSTLRVARLALAFLLLLIPVLDAGCGAVYRKTADSGPEETVQRESQHAVKVPEHSSAPETTPAPAESPAPATAAAFDLEQCVSHTRYLASVIGAREEGSQGEALASLYIQDRLREYGYAPFEQAFQLPRSGLSSLNVVATLAGGDRPQYRLVIGAHMDTRNRTGVCPGANDNATGCAVLLELARVLKINRRVVPAIDFVFFGAEEIPPEGSPDDHHFGSRHFVALQGAGELANIAGMISVDMVGYGSDFHARNMCRAPQAMVDLLLGSGRSLGLTYKQDPEGMSDHEPFETAGIPSVWVESRDDPSIHGPGDTFEHVDFSKVQNAGLLVQGFLEQFLTPQRVDELIARPGATS